MNAPGGAKRKSDYGLAKLYSRRCFPVLERSRHHLVGSAHATQAYKFVTELPMTGVGKVDKKVLKAGFWTGRDRMVG